MVKCSRPTTLNRQVDFMTAVNSGKRIKPDTWANYGTLQDVLDSLSYIEQDKLVELLNGYWNIEE